MTIFFIALATAIHIYIFCLESLLWGKANTNRVFDLKPEAAEVMRLMAFNQGFYNFFLSLGAGVGLFLGIGDPVGKALVTYALASMVAAAVVLIASNPRLIRAAVVQGLPPLIALTLLWLTAG